MASSLGLFYQTSFSEFSVKEKAIKPMKSVCCQDIEETPADVHAKC
jgi:hypothetical protein